jgi:hypothetical protein
MTVDAVDVLVVLRHNTQLAGDVRLAVREFEALAELKGQPLASPDDVYAAAPRLRALRRVHFAKTASPVAVLFRSLPLDGAWRIVQRSGFAQVVVLLGDSSVLRKASATSTCPLALVNELEATAVVALAQNYVVESEGVLGGPSVARVERTIELLLQPFTRSKPTTESNRVRGAKKTTLSYSHDLHIYKAKFFPRMVRALMNIFAPRGGLVFDPYCGSGTTLVEASLLGLRSAGIDMDPICVTMTRAKTTCLRDPAAVQATVDSLNRGLRIATPRAEGFPAELKAKLGRRDKREGTDFLPEIVDEAGRLANAIATTSGDLERDLIQTLASDAVTKKVRYRYVGVGNGKYTIEVIKQPILERLREKLVRSRELADVTASLAQAYQVELGSIAVERGDARKPDSWPVTVGTVDLIVTSPPYLPASSGREHYASSRALAFFVLGMEPGEHGYYDLDAGSASNDLELTSFPEALRLMEYLRSDQSETADPQRDAMRFERKATPTLAYLSDVRAFFAGARSTLSPTGRLIYVVANQHTFYSHRRGEVEHVARCRDLYAEIAEAEGFSLEEEIPMELLKSAASRAKPRAKDQYFESVPVFRRATPALDEVQPAMVAQEAEQPHAIGGV